MPASKVASGTRAEADGSPAVVVRVPLLPIALAGLVHGMLMMLAFPTVEFWPAALVALVPLVWAAGRLERALREGVAAGAPGRRLARAGLRAALVMTLSVMPLYIWQLQWLIPVTAVGYVPMAFGMGLFAGGFIWLTAELRLRLPRLPLAVVVGLVWTAFEVFRGEIAFSGYAWFFIAHPLIDAPVLPMPAPVLGTYSIIFLLAAAAGAAGDLWFGERKRRRAGAVALVCIAAAFSASVFVPAPANGGPVLRVAVIQTNLPQDNKVAWTMEQKILDFQRFMELSWEAATADPRPDLIIWPESMFPELLNPQAVAEQRRVGLVYNVDPEIVGVERIAATDFHDALLALHRQTGVTLLIGVVGVDNLRITEDEQKRIIPETDAQYNSMMLIADGEVHPERYDKLKLTPFGEVMPYLNAWPWLERQLMALGAAGMQFNLHAGEEVRTLEVKAADGTRVGIATPICFESTKPRLNGMLVRNIEEGLPRLLVNATNDGWFGNFESGRRQHMQIARWRALEQGVPMLRAANTGVSAFIDARGQVVKLGPDVGPESHSDGILTAEVRPTVGRTIYGRTGDIFAWLALATGGGLCFVAFISGRRATG